MRKIRLYFITAICILLAGIPLAHAQNKPVLMNMVHHNPGEPPSQSKYLDPGFLKQEGYGSKVFFLFEAAQFGIDWQKFDPEIFPAGTKPRAWVNDKAALLDKEYTETKKQGLKVYCMIDMIVLPTTLVDKYRDSICDAKAKIDITRPFTQKCMRALVNQMFDRFPQLDGLVVRTGETYLNDAPFYKGNNPVTHGLQDHVVLLNILRDEVCVKRNKDLFYRTWDDGKFHSLPQDYLKVTNQVAPHPKLYFSIKHTIVDFWRGSLTSLPIDYDKIGNYWINEASHIGVPFNPCLGIGKHKQVVEVQCQREYEGKCAHPNYIAAGVIDGFDELKVKGAPTLISLNAFKKDSHYAGVWTWARGGGWGGPFITNEFWCELNANIMAQWAMHPNLTEKQLFWKFAMAKGLPEVEIPVFHELCLLSAKGVMQGQYSEQGEAFVLWTRDDAIGDLGMQKSYFDKLIADNKAEVYLNEKKEAVKTWQKIEQDTQKLHFKDKATTSFVKVSSTYGRIKYAIFEKALSVMLRGYIIEKAEGKDFSSLQSTIADYDRLWAEWNKLKADHVDCPTLYKQFGKYGSEGLTATIDHFRVK
jgi:hypothetical protein